MSNEQQNVQEVLPTEIDLFAMHPQGYRVHVHLASKSPQAALRNLDVLAEGLAAKGYKPEAVVGAPVSALAASPAAQPAAPAVEAVWLKGENGRPPSCSVHGAGKWLEGVSKGSNKPYAFWACKQRDCRPKGEAA